MKKQIVTMLCGAAAVALAVPAFSATTTLSGTLRIQAIDQNIQVATDKPNRKFVSQRFSPVLGIQVNDLVKIVYAGEIDTDWGVNSSSTAGFDGAQSADGVNLETKQIYTAIKFPGDNNVTVTAGIQPAMDGLQGIFIRDDFPGLTGVAKFGTVDFAAGWLKVTEAGASPSATPTLPPNTTTSYDGYALSDDIDIYFLKAGVVPAENAKLGLELYWLHGQGGARDTAGNYLVDTGKDLYTLGLTGAAKVGPVALDGFLAWQTGTYNVDNSSSEADVNAFAASCLASMKFNDNLSGNLRLIYFGNDNDADDVKSFQDQYAAGSHRLNFLGANQPIFLANAYKTGVGGYSDNVVQGFLPYGLLAAIANVEYNMAPYYVRGAVGYYQTLKDEANASGVELEGTHLGYELFLQTGMKVADVADVFFRGSYALLGNAFDDAAAGDDPDNMYTATIGTTIPF